MTLYDLIDTVYARAITIIEEKGGVTEIAPNGCGYQYTIQRACKKFGNREVLNVCDMGKGETVIMIA